MSLLPSKPDTSAAEEPDPRVIGVDSEDADDVLSALSADTARQLLTALHEDPAPPAALADRVDTSLQNAQYHLGNLEEAGAIEVVDTMYSEKGREMNVYAPADRPLVIFAGDDEQSSGLRAALSRLLGSVGILAFASLAVQELFGDGVLGPFGSQDGREPSAAPAAADGNGTAAPTDGSGGDLQPDTDTVEIHGEFTSANGTETDIETATQTATDAAGTVTDATTATDPAAAALSLPPGLLFFLGGLTALLVVGGLWYATR